ncbi:MAG TPA: hypothetical protein PK228_05560 [Saprospiraceae bacterium]|nr:hypothetical protein [Saprospiraceae bacterium]
MGRVVFIGIVPFFFSDDFGETLDHIIPVGRFFLFKVFFQVCVERKQGFQDI